MGRPSNCGCCGTVPPDIGPSSICSYTTGYFNRQWDEQDISGCTYSKYNSNTWTPGPGPINNQRVSGEVIRLNWVASSSVIDHNEMPWYNCGYGSGWWNCYCHWFCENEYWYNYEEYRDYVYLPCVDKWGKTGNHQYSLVLTKDAYFESGVLICAAIKSLSNFVDAKILINDGSENIITEIFDYQNDYYGPRWLGKCLLPLCATGVYKTRDSGCFRIIVSGSTNRIKNNGFEIYPSGFIDFWITPSSSINQTNYSLTRIKPSSYMEYDALCTPFSCYFDCYDFRQFRNCYSDCIGFSCCQFCEDCDSKFCKSTGATRWWWNGFWNINHLLNVCSGDVAHPECGTPEYNGQKSRGPGWEMYLTQFCGNYNNFCDCEDDGACCLPNNNCVVTDCKACEQASGIWLGKGTSCYGEGAFDCAFAP